MSGPLAGWAFDTVLVSNRGEIACLGTLPNGNLRVVLLVPAGLAARQGLSGTPATSQP